MDTQTTPTYAEQWQKLTTAYVNGQVDPFDCKACFVGNMLNRDKTWGGCTNYSLFSIRKYGVVGKGLFDINGTEFKDAIESIKKQSNGFYSPQEIADIEALFLYTIHEHDGNISAWRDECVTEQDEVALFKAFEVTLEHLKQLHISKGEVIDDTPIFQKRTLANVQ